MFNYRKREKKFKLKLKVLTKVEYNKNFLAMLCPYPAVEEAVAIVSSYTVSPTPLRQDGLRLGAPGPQFLCL